MKKRKKLVEKQIVSENEGYVYWIEDNKVFRAKKITSYSKIWIDANSVKEIKKIYSKASTKLAIDLKPFGVKVINA